MKGMLWSRSRIIFGFGLLALQSLSLGLLPTAWTGWGAPYALAADDASNVKTPSIHELEHGIADRLKRVEEFRFIEQEAHKLGVRAWLFGGTAAGYAHYVKWDMQREKGDKRFQPDRFDYDYTNIYRSNQDLDIVIDGNAAQAERLQTALQEKYPHLQGNKTAWEVRLLTQDMGDKQAILNNPDFMNQHTDSNSTGLVEITKPKQGESVVRDVRDWNAKEPYFLKDVHDGALHYYFSQKHGTTQFAQEGRNPPILSVIRFLNKAFQYELKIRPEDLSQIKKLIESFDVLRDAKNPYVGKWIEKNGKKLIQNAVNIEYAWDTLDQLGLRKKLMAIKSDANVPDSLAWWMEKEPLRTQSVGTGSGKTAKELDIDVVAHETNHFLAYESITRAHTGDPNVLVSRSGAAGEDAWHGAGFYTKKGVKGGRGTGLTIRFHLDPNAREGTDFTIHNTVVDGYQVVIKNKAALKVIPESLDVTPVEYFKMVASESVNADRSNLGVIEKLKRRIGAKLHNLTQGQADEIVRILNKTPVTQGNAYDVMTPAWSEWFTWPVSARYPELAEPFLKQDLWDREVVKHILSQPHWMPLIESKPHWVERLIDRGKAKHEFVKNVLSQPHAKKHPEWFEKVLSDGKSDREFAEYVLSQPHAKEHPEWFDKIFQRGDADRGFVRSVLSQPLTNKHLQWIEGVLNAESSDRELAQYVLSQPYANEHPQWIEKILERGQADEELAQYVFSQPHIKVRPEWMEKIVKRGEAHWQLASFVLSQPHMKDHPEWLEKMINDVAAANIKRAPKNGFFRGQIVGLLTKAHWQQYPHFVGKVLETGFADQAVVEVLFPRYEWWKHPEWIEKIVENGKAGPELEKYFRERAESDHLSALASALSERRRLPRENLNQILALASHANKPEVQIAPKIANADGPSHVSATPPPFESRFVIQPEKIPPQPVPPQSLEAKAVPLSISPNESESDILNKIYRGPYDRSHYDFVKKSIQNGRYDELIARYILSKEPWQNHPDLVLELLKKNHADVMIVDYVLTQTHWQQHPELVRALIEKGTVDALINLRLLSLPHWKTHPVLSRLAGPHENPSVTNLRRAIERGDSFKYLPSEVVDCLKWQLGQQLK